LIQAIRQVDPDKIVMFEPSFGDSSMAGADLTLLGTRRNVVFSMHDYYAGGAGDGYAPGGEQLNAAAGARYAWDGRTGYHGTPAELEAHLRVNLSIMRAAGIPVWIGEFAINPAARRAEQWIRDKVALFERERVGHAWWLYGYESTLAALHPEPRGFRPYVRLLTPEGRKQLR
jgi:hypothetical protein